MSGALDVETVAGMPTITRTGDHFANPATHETGHFVTGASDTEGRYMCTETRIGPGGAVSIAHRHRECSERFEIVEGELEITLDGTARTYAAGAVVTIEPGVAHRYANTSSADAVFRCEVWPAERFESMVLTMFALAVEGRTDDKGAPSPLQMAVILDEFADVLELVGPPRWLQRLVIPVLARLGRARGLQPTYERHAGVYAQWQERLAVPA